MKNDRTIEEKAAQWNVSERHMQNLCKSGKIKGAVKRAGVWFIPDDAIIPVRNTKSGASGFAFVGTKKRIFDQSIELIKQRGYEGVSMTDIAEAVGIGQAGVYHHFKSKQEILDTIYDFLCHYFHADRPTIEQIEPILRGGSLIDIIRSVRYGFNKEYEQKLIDIITIVFHRMAIDRRANDIYKTLIMWDGIRFTETVFERAVEIGRLAPLDTHAMAVFIHSISLFTLYNWMLDPSEDYTIRVLEDEQTLYRHATELMTDLGQRDRIKLGV